MFNKFKNLFDKTRGLSMLKNKGGAILWFFGKNAFWMILLFFLVSVIIGEVVFFRFAVLTKISQNESLIIPVKFKENLHQEFLKNLRVENDLIKNSPSGDYQDPFE